MSSSPQYTADCSAKPFLADVLGESETSLCEDLSEGILIKDLVALVSKRVGVIRRIPRCLVHRHRQLVAFERAATRRL